jgi:hypothetical protein
MVRFVRTTVPIRPAPELYSEQDASWAAPSVHHRSRRGKPARARSGTATMLMRDGEVMTLIGGLSQNHAKVSAIPI